MYPDKKIYHKADKINEDGGVSALCFASPKAIKLAVASWTLQWKFVTCKKCLKLKPAAHGT